LAKHQGRPPADLATLKKWAESLPKADLHNLYGSENPDLSKAFTSPRDGQEYVLRKSSGGVPGGGDGAGRVLLYERTGDSQGKRFVAFETGQVEEVDAEKFKKLVPEAK